MTDAGNPVGQENAGVAMTDPPSGIPRGNTVVVVGDPGTGKTTFLLTYVTHGSLVKQKEKKEDEKKDEKNGKWSWAVCLKAGDTENNKAFEKINQLFKPALTQQDAKEDKDKKMGTLRCFISLENNLSRLLDNHKKLLDQWVNESSSNDQFVVIDATAFLSGRLDDRLRYPRLRGGSQEKERLDSWSKHSYDLNLGGHDLDEDGQFGLYYHADKKDPKRIEQLDDEAVPFSRKDHDDKKPISCRCFNLITRPISDPFQRVRLLKDLLAEVFIRFPEYKHRLLAIDSLSALLNPFSEDDLSANASPARRLNILNLVRWLEEYGVTTFLACEAERDTGKTWGGHPLFLGTEERYLASGVIQLNYHEYPSGDIVRY